MVESDLQFRLRALLLQEGIGRSQFLVRFVAQGRHLVRLDLRGHGEDADWYAQHLHVRVESGRGDCDLVRVLDVGALVRGRTGQGQGFLEEIWK